MIRKSKNPTSKFQFLFFDIFIIAFILVQLAFCSIVPSFFAFEFIIVSVSLAFYLYQKEKPGYYYFSLMLWATAPFFRRLNDLQMGLDPVSPILVAPAIVSAITLMTLLKFDKNRHPELVFPLVLIGLAIGYAFALGVINFGIFPSLYEGSLWVVPISFGLSIAINGEYFEEIYDSVSMFFRHFLIVGGIYGIYQFISPAPWDVYWMIKVPMNSIGEPYPYMVRVFSTLNAPGVFAQYIMISLLLANEYQSNLKWFGLMSGYGSFLLSMVRSAWGGWIVSFFAMAGAVKITNLYKYSMILGVLGLVLYLASYFEPIGTIIDKRFNTISNLDSDYSLRARIAQYDTFFTGIIEEPLGIGFGNSSNSSRLGERTRISSFQNFDSGIANLFSVYGWIGSIFYLAGMILLFAQKRFGLSMFADRGMTACLVALLLQFVFFNVLVSAVGILVWLFLFLRIAQRKDASPFLYKV